MATELSPQPRPQKGRPTVLVRARQLVATTFTRGALLLNPCDHATRAGGIRTHSAEPTFPLRFPSPNPRKLFKNSRKTLTSPPPDAPPFPPQLRISSILTTTPARKARFTEHFYPTAQCMKLHENARFPRF